MSLLIHHPRASMHHIDSAFAHAGWASAWGFGSIFSAILARVVGFSVVDVTVLRALMGVAASLGSLCFGIASLVQAGLAVKRYLDDRADKRRERFQKLYRVASTTTADPTIKPPRDQD